MFNCHNYISCFFSFLSKIPLIYRSFCTVVSSTTIGWYDYKDYSYFAQQVSEAMEEGCYSLAWRRCLEHQVHTAKEDFHATHTHALVDRGGYSPRDTCYDLAGRASRTQCPGRL